jgi:hypothetical protein
MVPARPLAAALDRRGDAGFLTGTNRIRTIEPREPDRFLVGRVQQHVLLFGQTPAEARRVADDATGTAKQERLVT